MKRQLEKARAQLVAFERIATDYPNSGAYKKMVLDLQQQQADLADQIGRPKKT